MVRETCNIFDVGNLDLANGSIAVLLVLIHHDIICLDIRIHNTLLV